MGLKAALKSGFLLLLAWILGDENDDRRAIEKGKMVQNAVDCLKMDSDGAALDRKIWPKFLLFGCFAF